jgi:hypothetical protein
MVHLREHVFSLACNGIANTDRVSGLREATHVVVRALQVLQRAIDNESMADH